jgi:hypothetical protein
MKTCTSMARVVEAIAKKHHLDLDEVGAHLRLEQPAYEPLCIEVIGERLVSVAHYFEQHGDLVPDPEMVFCTYPDRQWVPVEITMAIGRRRVASEVEDGRVARFSPREQADQAGFANVWARNLREQGWAALGREAER